MEINYSFIIPHYNIPELLQRCILSIPQRDDVQIIVVDDCSPKKENVQNQIKEFGRCNIELYPLKDHVGAGRARNIGLSHVKGKKVLFADADDFYVDNLDAILNRYLYDDSDIIFFNTKSVRENDYSEIKTGLRGKTYLFDYYHKTDDERVFRYQYKEPWGKIFNTDFLKRNNIIFDNTPVANDYFFSVRSGLLASKISIVDEILYVVVKREGSLSYLIADTEEKLMARIEVTSCVQHLLAQNGLFFKPMLICPLTKMLLRKNPQLIPKELKIVHKNGISRSRLLFHMVYYFVHFHLLKDKKNSEMSFPKPL